MVSFWFAFLVVIVVLWAAYMFFCSCVPIWAVFGAVCSWVLRFWRRFFDLARLRSLFRKRMCDRRKDVFDDGARCDLMFFLLYYIFYFIMQTYWFDLEMCWKSTLHPFLLIETYPQPLYGGGVGLWPSFYKGINWSLQRGCARRATMWKLRVLRRCFLAHSRESYLGLM